MGKMKTGLNDRHRLILELLRKRNAENAPSPTLREIGKALGIRSVSLVNYYLERLEADGYIHREKLSPHKVEITLAGSDRDGKPFIYYGGKMVRGELVIIPIVGVLKNECIRSYWRGNNS
jgi:repressor LexA